MSLPDETPPVRRREIFGWAMFDFANSSYTTVVISFVYSAFFVGWVVPQGSEARDSYWSLAILLSTVIALFASPLVGAICDYSGRKKRYLAMTAIVCAVSTMALGLTGPGTVGLAIALIVVSNAAFMLGEPFCGSFLPELADEKSMGKISGIGWGLGYFGGLASMVIATIFIIGAAPGERMVRGADADGVEVVVEAEEPDTWIVPGIDTVFAERPDAVEAARTAPGYQEHVDDYVGENRLAMLATGLFFLLAAIPTFVLLRNRSRPVPGFEGASLARLAGAGWREMKGAAATARDNPILFKFLVAFMIYMAGLDAIIKFVGIYATEEVRLSAGQMIMLFLVLQVSAAAGAVLFGFVESRIGAKKTVLITLAGWVGAGIAIVSVDGIAGALGISPQDVFIVIAIVAGAGIGSLQSSSRAVVGLLAPRDKTAQMFGFWSMFQRLGMILGTSFGFVSDAFDSRQVAVLLVVGFFAAGALLLVPLDIDGEARRRATQRAT